MIKLENLTVRIAGRTLIEHLSLTLNEGHRYGFIGRNGTGKSTFFKVLLNEHHPEAGFVEIPARVRLGHFAQEAPEWQLAAAMPKHNHLVELTMDKIDKKATEVTRSSLMLLGALAAREKEFKIYYNNMSFKLI